MKLTIIHPCIGRRIGEPYIRTWQMEPLAPAVLASLTPPDVQIAFYDDRMEVIPYDEPTDLVAISVETYTARRAYQIATQYRLRGVPVVMGGFHATLVPDEVSEYAEATVIGEAEGLWAQVIEDARAVVCSASTDRRTGRRSMACGLTDRSSPGSVTCQSAWSRPGAAAISAVSSAPSSRISTVPRPAA